MGFTLLCAYYCLAYLNNASIMNAFIFMSIIYLNILNYYFKNCIIDILCFFFVYFYIISIMYLYLVVPLCIASFNFSSFIFNWIYLDISEYFVNSSSGQPGKSFFGNNSGGQGGGSGGGSGGGPGGNNNPYFIDPHQGSSSTSKTTGDSYTTGREQTGDNPYSNYPTSPSGSSISTTYTDDSTSFEPLSTHHNFNLRGNEIEGVCIDILKGRATSFSKNVTITDLNLNAGAKYSNYVLDWASIYLKRNPLGPLKDFANNVLGSNRGQLVIYSADNDGIGRQIIDSIISTKPVSHPSFKPNTYNELAEYFSYKLQNKTPANYTVNQLLQEGTEADKSAWNKFREFVLLHPDYRKGFNCTGSSKDVGNYTFLNIDAEKGKNRKSNIINALINQ